MEKLVELNILFYDNGLMIEGGIMFANALSRLLDLSTLKVDLRTNHLGEEGTNAITEEISKLPKLKHLDISFWNNEIKDSKTLLFA